MPGKSKDPKSVELTEKKKVISKEITDDWEVVSTSDVPKKTKDQTEVKKSPKLFSQQEVQLSYAPDEKTKEIISKIDNLLKEVDKWAPDLEDDDFQKKMEDVKELKNNLISMKKSLQGGEQLNYEYSLEDAKETLKQIDKTKVGEDSKLIKLGNEIFDFVEKKKPAPKIK